jgi:hypothetical protein
MVYTMNRIFSFWINKFVFINALSISNSSGLQMEVSNQTGVSSNRYSTGGKSGTFMVPVIYIRFGNISHYMRVSIQSSKFHERINLRFILSSQGWNRNGIC